MGRSSAAGPTRRGVRIFLGFCALGAVVWSVSALRDELAVGPFDTVAERIAVGHRYRPDAIQRALPYVEKAEEASGCTRAYFDTAIIRVQARQIAAAAGDRPQAERHLARAIQDLENDLGCAPSRGMSWFLLFAMRSTRDGQVAAHLPLLGMSYQLAPNEGSFTPLRVRAALPLLPAFGPNMKSYVENDYRAMVRDQIGAALDIFLESNPANRLVLAPFLKEASASGRAIIIHELNQRDVPLPEGMEPVRR